MSKSNITLIIVLMSLASFGLMGFQYYWIRNAIRINKERFDQNALQAIAETVTELEKGETSDVLLSKLIKDPVLKETIFKKIDPKFDHAAPYDSKVCLLGILTTSKPGDIILDNFSGTASQV